MKEILLFTDGSVNVQSKIGCGGYLLVEKPFLALSDYKNQIKLKSFENTSSTKLELETLLWALKEIKSNTDKITIYTDSQNIISLLKRRQKLEQKNYYSAKNELIKNHLLYKEFFRITDNLNCDFIKLKGHLPKHKKTEIDLLFSLVDKATRKALRENNTISK